MDDGPFRPRAEKTTLHTPQKAISPITQRKDVPELSQLCETTQNKKVYLSDVNKSKKMDEWRIERQTLISLSRSILGSSRLAGGRRRGRRRRRRAAASPRRIWDHPSRRVHGEQACPLLSVQRAPSSSSCPSPVAATLIRSDLPACHAHVASQARHHRAPLGHRHLLDAVRTGHSVCSLSRRPQPNPPGVAEA